MHGTWCLLVSTFRCAEHLTELRVGGSRRALFSSEGYPPFPADYAQGQRGPREFEKPQKETPISGMDVIGLRELFCPTESSAG